MNEIGYLPHWLILTCCISAGLSMSISLYSIYCQLINYRIPQQQRLVLRIQMMVPIFSVTCLISIIYPKQSIIFVDPIREIYESFVIYTFFSLLILILGGERRILLELSLGKAPVSHPILFIGTIIPKFDISDPIDFLRCKRGILQYVWFKPGYCLLMSIFELNHWESKWLVCLYNISASWSLYNLALFWKCLYDNLQQHNPWPKFLCVKLIIFASYWQGMIIGLLQYYGVIKNFETINMGYIYQNVALSLEMIAFSIAHQIAFSFHPYSIKNLSFASRMEFKYAIKDWLGIQDLKLDFTTTFFGNSYSYRNFDSVEAIMAHRDSRSTINRLNNGLRYTNGGNNRYWVTQDPELYGSIENESWDDLLHNMNKYIPEDPNYPVIFDMRAHKFSNKINELRKNLVNSQRDPSAEQMLK